MEQRIQIQKTYKLFIDGKYPRTESGRYHEFKSHVGNMKANVCLSSRKDFRDAVVAARGAFSKWSQATAYNRGQILYRVAEMLEGRKNQFKEELVWEGLSEKEAEHELALSIDRLVYYAGWSDKYQQILSSVNPVASNHFNFSMTEAMGVVGVIAPSSSSLLGLISLMAPILVGGNTCVILSHIEKPLTPVTFGEVLGTSDIPAGVVNILTGTKKELLSHFSSHMDVNAMCAADLTTEERKSVDLLACENLKRVRFYNFDDWKSATSQKLDLISDYQEIKTTWHPVGV